MQTNNEQIRTASVMLHNIDEAAFLLSVSPSTVRRYIKDGSLRTVKLSPGVVRVEDSELMRFVKASAIGVDDHVP